MRLLTREVPYSLGPLLARSHTREVEPYNSVLLRILAHSNGGVALAEFTIGDAPRILPILFLAKKKKKGEDQDRPVQYSPAALPGPDPDAAGGR